MSVVWQPCGLFNGNPERPYAVLILNQLLNRKALDAVIDNAALVVCADAGGDRYYEYEDGVESGKQTRTPDAIVGDLDSLSSKVESHYRQKGVKIVKDPDQYSTDFTKCLKWLRMASVEKSGSENVVQDVIVLGGLGGRVDQAFSQIHHLYVATNDPTLINGRIFLLSEQSLSFVLEEGHNIIRLEPGFFEESVGIVPVLGPDRITIKGFEWDVTDWPTAFGDQISTSNHIRSNELEISFENNRPLFTVELAKHLQ